MRAVRTAHAISLAALALGSAVCGDVFADEQNNPAREYTAASALEEVTVTARKREEGLQSAPISITAFTGEGLDYRGVTKIDQIADFTPNLTYQSNPGEGGSSASAAIYIRGIGQNDFVPTVEPGVGLYVDGVYVARSVGSILDLVDVERVEVLRGPQGTLFGRNTVGGAISVTTKKPDEIPGGKAELTLGSSSRVDFRGTVNMPLSETVFSRVSIGTFNRDGYVTRPFDGKDLGDEETTAGQVALRWLASDDLEFNLSFDGTHENNNGAPMVTTALIMPDQPGYLDTFMALNNVLALGDPFSCFEPENLNVSSCYNTRFIQGDENINGGTAAHFSDLGLWGVNLTADWKLGSVSIKSITAYRELDSTFARDIDESPLVIGHVWDSLDQTQFSQELQFIGDSLGGRLEWIGGLYYFEEDADNVNRLEFTVANFLSGGKVRSKSWAAFGQATYAITEKVKLTGGMRYTEDDKTFLPDSVITAVNVPPSIFPFPEGTRILPYEKAANDISQWTPLLNLSYQVTDDFMAYVTYSEGFKSGGFTQRVFPPEPSIPSFDPEFVKAYEAGFKFSGFNNKLRLNGAVFHTKYDDLQLLISNLSRVGPFTENAAEAEINGFELELTAAPGGGWLIEGGVGYLDPEYKKVDEGALGITLDSKFQRISDWTWSAAISRDISIGSNGSIVPRIDWSYRSSFYNNALNSPEIKQDGYHLVNANIAWHTPADSFQVILGVTNLTDERYMITGYIQPNFGNYESLFARDREWYLSGRYSF